MTHDRLSVIAENLSALSSEASSVIERRIAHIYGLARAFAGGVLSDALRSEYAKLLEIIERPEQNSPVPEHFVRLSSRADRIALCGFIYENLGGQPAPPSAEKLLGCTQPEGKGDMPNRICYLHNYFSDKAYNVFAEALENPTVTYATDFTGVCEDVYYGRAKYCILPVESSADGMLSGFRTLVGKYELNYSLTCDIHTQDGEDFTRFALLHRGIVPPPGAASGERVFEFSASFDDGGATLGDVIDAAEAYGLKLRHVSLLPASYSGRSGMYDLAFSYEEKGLPEFIVFLSLEVPQFEALGLYTHLGGSD